MKDATRLRRARARALAGLMRRIPNTEEAEDCLQTALVRGLELWTTQPMPTQLSAWLMRVAWNAHLDRSRRPVMTADVVFEGEDFDGLERALFLRCHATAVPSASRPALVLRWLGGLSLPQIAEVLEISLASVDKRLHRGRQAIQALPETLRPQLEPMLQTLGVVFGVAYDERSVSTVPEARMVLALDLVHHLTRTYPQRTEAWACSAWLHLTAARAPARRDAGGRLLLAEEQDRVSWSEGLLRLGIAALGKAVGDVMSDWHLLAGIAAQHAGESVDWVAVRNNHRVLHERHPDGRFVTGLAHAAWRVDGPRAGWTLLQESKDDSIFRWILEARLLHALHRDPEPALRSARTRARSEEQRECVGRVAKAMGLDGVSDKDR